MTVLHSATDSNCTTAALGVTVRIGVFFDGTGNNRINSQIGADCQAMAEIYNGAHIKECGGRHLDPNSSYSNDLTNIARLADLYRDLPVARNEGHGLKVYQAVYISGIGTTSGGRDSRVSGQGFGRGRSGVVAKVSKCIKKINDVLSRFRIHNPDCVIGALEFDVFGFSRGAAAARHLANEVLKQSRGEFNILLRKGHLPLAPGFSWTANSVRLKVIGLFDTVAAIGSISDLGNVRDSINSRVNLFLPPGCAQQVLHLVAADEHRRNFALNRVAPDWPREIILPGSHSDIGGGYQPQSMEAVSLTRPRRCVVSLNTPYDATDAWRQTHAEMDTLDVQRWLDPQDDSASVGIECFERVSGPGMKSVVASVRLERRVFGHLSRIYLRVMHGLACDEGVPFQPVPDTADLSLPPELRGVAVKLLAYARGQGAGLSDDELRMLYHRYIHCSAHWNASIGRRGALFHSLFLHAPAVGGRQGFLNPGQPA